MVKKQKIKFLNLKSASVVNDEQKVQFTTIDDKKIDDNYITLADPAYGYIFKKLFLFENKINNVSGRDRMKNFINSLIFPNAGKEGKKVRELNYLPNKMTNLNNKYTKLGVLIVDIACECLCCMESQYELLKKKEKINDINSNDINIIKRINQRQEEIEKNKKIKIKNDEYSFLVIFNIEMQTEYEIGLDKRCVNYGFDLRSYNGKKPVVILSLLNFKSSMDEFSNWETGKITGTKVFNVIENGQAIHKINDFIDVYYHYFPKEMESILKNKDFITNKKTIGETGKKWLKLLGMRQWCTRDKNRLRYLFPESLSGINKEISSAIDILKHIKEEEYSKYINMEKVALNISTGRERKELRKEFVKEKEEGLHQRLVKGRKKGMKKEMLTKSKGKLFQNDELMRYINSINKARAASNMLIGAEKKGIEKGIKKGIKHGMREGIKQGLIEGEKEGRRRGLKIGGIIITIEVVVNHFKKNIDNKNIKTICKISDKQLKNIQEAYKNPNKENIQNVASIFNIDVMEVAPIFNLKNTNVFIKKRSRGKNDKNDGKKLKKTKI